MAGDERRAEIEAATDALLADSGLPRYGGHRATIERRMAIAFDAADRVRDARSDEELHSENERLRELYANQANIKARGWTVDHLMECEEALRMAESRVAELEAEARSPQGEDHEAGIEAAAQAICGVAGWGPHYGGEHREMAERAIAAYLSASPSRDGTVAQGEEVAESWRCTDCNCVNREDEAFCFRCGAGQPEFPARVTPSRDGTVAVEDVERLIDARESMSVHQQRESWLSPQEVVVLDPAEWAELDAALSALAELARSATGEQTDHGGDQ